MYFITSLKPNLASKKLVYLINKIICISTPKHVLHPINKDNAYYSCITAAAGTCIGHNFLVVIHYITKKVN